MPEFCLEGTTTTPPPDGQLLYGLDPSALCSLLPAPVSLQGLVRNVLAAHFADPGNIQELDLRSLIWRLTGHTGIVIETFDRWRPEQTEGRPAIILRNNSFSLQRLSVGNVEHSGSDAEGNRRYAVLWTGSQTLFCIADNSTQAHLLAWEASRELLEFAPELIGSVNGLVKFEPLEIGGEGLVEEAQQRIGVPLTCGYQFNQAWTIRPRAPRLKTVQLEFEL